MAARSPVFFLRCALLAASFSAAYPATPSTTAERSCSVGPSGTLTMFNQESAMVKVPCKYRLADFTCGDYTVKVTPGSAVGDDALFHPTQMWVKVVNMTTGDMVKIRTSLDVISKYEAGKLSEPWKTKEGDTEFLDFVGIGDGVARLEKDGVFRVELGHDGVQVSCSVDQFSSTGLPHTLCGDGKTKNEAETVIEAYELYDISPDHFMTYIIMNDTAVTQSKTCEGLASRVRTCENKEAMNCNFLFEYPYIIRCLKEKENLTTTESYDRCLSYLCDGDMAAAQPLFNCVD